MSNPISLSNSRRDGIRSMLVGAAIGDALGAAFEMLPARVIRTYVDVDILEDYVDGLEGSLLSGHPAGTVTDDTAMSVSVARTLLRVGINAKRDDFTSGFLRDLVSGRDEVAVWFDEGGPGRATIRALRYCDSQSSRGTSTKANVAETPGYLEAGGNATVMRVAPVAAVNMEDDCGRLAECQALATHGHVAAAAAAKELAIRLHRMLRGKRPPADCIVDNETLRNEWIRYTFAPERALTDAPMTAWSTGAVAWAICECFAWDPARALTFAVLSGTDTDTVASVTGALLGAYHKSLYCFPRLWLDHLSARDTILEIADNLSDAFVRS